MARTWFLRYDHSSLQRLGALKVLVALLDEQRRSIASEKLDNSLLHLLLADPDGHVRVGRRPIPKPRPPGGTAADAGKGFPRNVAENLLADIDAPSLLFTVTEPKVSRIREWGKQLGFLGNGNQITERGLLLQHFMGADQVTAIRKGERSTHNPFRLSLSEKVYFLYVLLERDGVWPFLIRRLAERGKGALVSGIEADKLTCRALSDLLRGLRPGLSASELFRRRELRRLVAYMAESLGIEDETGPSVPVVPRVSRARRPEQRGRTRTNTADDQAIPRFENLVDLGFLAKETEAERASEKWEESLERRIEWRYVIAEPLIKWADAAGGAAVYDDEFLWKRFASCAAAAFRDGGVELSPAREPVKVMELLLEAYGPIHRPIGHTPFESVALTAMVLRVARGIVCEMAWMHDLVLRFKREGLFSEYLRFASGNDLDRMFIDIRPGLLDRVRGDYAS